MQEVRAAKKEKHKEEPITISPIAAPRARFPIATPHVIPILFMREKERGGLQKKDH